MITDPIGDMIARIKNAYLAGHKTILLPYSKMKLAVAEVMVKNYYLIAAESIGEESATKMLKLTLRYQAKEPAIQDIRRVSKPGHRVYKQSKNLKAPLSGLGTSIVSTSSGVMTLKEAKKQKLGGELICEIW